MNRLQNELTTAQRAIVEGRRHLSLIHPLEDDGEIYAARYEDIDALNSALNIAEALANALGRAVDALRDVQADARANEDQYLEDLVEKFRRTIAQELPY